jgi:hypothetical protein
MIERYDTTGCIGCEKTAETAQLERCRMCSKWYCPDCVYRQGGRRFCSNDCAQLYFYGDMDEDEQERLAEDDDYDHD